MNLKLMYSIKESLSSENTFFVCPNPNLPSRLVPSTFSLVCPVSPSPTSCSLHCATAPFPLRHCATPFSSPSSCLHAALSVAVAVHTTSCTVGTMASPLSESGDGGRVNFLKAEHGGFSCPWWGWEVFCATAMGSLTFCSVKLVGVMVLLESRDSSEFK
ncbi:hypothetical protein RJT34_16424 [Clitoria ternatea]|uniref:Uncharacterized protein n=1 Tax=Clitoria ternatea TaxID=43366 RepID=A0AAN9PCV2_CLITE